MTWHRRPESRARDLAVRRVRTVTVVTGIGSVIGAGSLALAVAGSDPAAWSATPTAAVPAHHHHHKRAHRRATPPRSLTATKRVHHHRAAPVVAPTSRPVQPVVTHTSVPAPVITSKPKPVATHTSAPTPSPTPTPSSTSSGGS